MPPSPDAFYATEDFDPQPGDDELITRGEHRRAIYLFVQRIGRVEQFLFEDELEADGKTVRRRSLYNLMDALDAYLMVMCSFARGARNVAKAVVLIGGAAMTIIGLLAAFGVNFL